MGAKWVCLVLFLLCLPSVPSARIQQCDDLEESADALEAAVDELRACVQKRDYDEDCSRDARDVRDAADDYETAVSEASDHFDGEASSVCPAPARIFPPYQ